MYLRRRTRWYVSARRWLLCGGEQDADRAVDRVREVVGVAGKTALGVHAEAGLAIDAPRSRASAWTNSRLACSSMSITTRTSGAVDHVFVCGELDLATRAQLVAVLHERLRAQRDVLLDLTGVTFIDGVGVGVVIDAALQATRYSCQMRVRPGERGGHVLRLTGLDYLILMD